jgi:hypothetical protein
VCKICLDDFFCGILFRGFLLVLRFFRKNLFTEIFRKIPEIFQNISGNFPKKWKNTKSIGKFPENFQNFSSKKFFARNIISYSTFGKILVILHISCHILCNLQSYSPFTFFFIQMQCTNQFQSTIFYIIIE